LRKKEGKKMSFEYPILIIGGIIAIIGSFWLSRFMKDAVTIDVPLGSPGGVPFKPPAIFSTLMRIVKFAGFLGIILFFIAAAGPILVSAQTVWLSRGADIIFALDISPSMAGLDMNNKSRFTASVNLIREFAQKRPADSVGLVAIGKDASLIMPPTTDRDALFSRLDALQLGELGDGTALGLGLAIAALHIGNSNAPRKAVALITDGENNAGAVHPSAAAALFPELGVSLWVIAVGSNGEIPIDYIDPFTKVRRTGFFESRFDPENLKTIAAKGNGAYISAPSASAFAEAFARFDQEETSVPRSSVITKTKSLFRPFAAASILLLLVARFIRKYLAGMLL
jgi:Ca-activated chloride channel family protein